MELLFTMDEENYSEEMPLVERYGVRGLVRRGNLWAMQYSEACGEYKIPGGGKEGDESDLSALIREVLEETGLKVIPDTVRAIGEVVERRRDQFDATKRYVAHSCFYFCEVEDKSYELCLTPSEIKKGYHPVWADLDTIIATNEKLPMEHWMQRDTKFLCWLRNHLELL